MCRWSKEELNTDEIRDNIPFRELRECGGTYARDVAIRGNPDLRSTPVREVTPQSEQQQPVIAQSPNLPADVATAKPTTSASVGLIVFGAGIGLLVWLVRSSLKPAKKSH